MDEMPILFDARNIAEAVKILIANGPNLSDCFVGKYFFSGLRFILEILRAFGSVGSGSALLFGPISSRIRVVATFVNGRSKTDCSTLPDLVSQRQISGG